MPNVSLPPGSNIATTFTFRCNMCGATVQVVDSAEQPHRCRIEFPDPSEG